MKKFKKTMAVVLTLVMCLSMMSVAAFAAGTVNATKDTFTYNGTDATTNGQISVSNATIGENYTLYKIFDATYDASDNTKVSYTVKTGALYNELKDSGGDYFTISATADGQGNYSVTRTGTTSEGTFTPTKTDDELITYLKGLDKTLFTEIGKIEKAGADSISFTKIPYGYYYMTSSLGTVVSIDSNHPTASIIDKNQKSTMDKVIVKGNTELKQNDAALEKDGTSYKITTNATNYDGDEKIYKYEISDTIDTAMTYTSEPVVQVKDGSGEFATPKGTKPYTIKWYKADGTETTDKAEAQKFVITLNWTTDGTFGADFLYSANATIKVTYDAKLDATKATSGGTLEVGGTTEANTNTATVKTYHDKTAPDNERTTPNGDVGTEKTETFTTELTILKTDENDKALQGAEFTLTGPTGSVIITSKDTFVENASGEYWLLKNGTYTTTDPNGPNGDKKDSEGRDIDQTEYESTTQKYAKTTETVVKGAGQSNTSITAAVGTDGKVTFTGLGEGKYTITESKVPDGYNKADDITFNVGFEVKTKVVEETTVFDKVEFTADNGITVESDNTLTVTIKNQKGTELPSTGGIGTTIFYLIGAILVIGAGVLLVTRRRMRTN